MLKLKNVKILKLFKIYKLLNFEYIQNLKMLRFKILLVF
jgi:hypothetical protein